MELELEIEKLVHGRAGLARHEGRVVFVDRVAPGDRVRAKVVRNNERYLEAELIELLEAGEARCESPCPIVDRCGGCPWQQVSYPRQLEAKRSAVIDSLERIAGIDNPEVAPVVSSPEIFGYRNRLKLRFEAGKLGFYRARSNSLVPVPDCLLAETRVREALAAAESFTASLSTNVTRVEIASRGLLPGVLLAVNSRGRLRRSDAHRVRETIERDDNPIAGVVMWGRGWRRHWGESARSHTVDGQGTVVTQSGGSFGQVNEKANLALVAAVAEYARGSRSVLEIYAGAGNFSLPLARCCGRVTAVEAYPQAVEAAKVSARKLGLGNLDIIERSARDFLHAYTGTAPELLLVDPPRNGLSDCAEAAARLKAPKLAYVSCNPATLARDLRSFIDHGYRFKQALTFDMFPHTFHVESFCSLELT